MAKFGNAAILWTSTEDANTQRVFLLDQPLVEVTPSHNQAVYRRESLDRSAVETYTVGNGAYELTGTIRYSADPDGLVEMLKAGSQGKNLTYIPNLNDSALFNFVQLIDPMSPTQAVLDAQRAGYGEHQVSVRFRKTDESPFTGQVKGTETIFAYRAGGSLRHGVSTGTFSRVTSTSAPASYASISTGDYGYGSISTAATNKLRVSWMANPTSVGPRTFPVALLERSRANRVKYSENLSQWTMSTVLTRTSGQNDPKGGTAAWKITDVSAGAAGSLVSTAFTVTSATFAVASLFVKEGTASTYQRFMRLTKTTGATIINQPFRFSSGRCVLDSPTAGVTLDVEQFRDGWYRISARSSAATSTNNHQFTIQDVASPVSSTGFFYAFGAQTEV